MVRVPLVAEQAQRCPVGDQADQLVELGDRRRGQQMRGVDAAQIGVSPGPGREPAVRWRTQAAQMQVIDPDRGDAGGELPLGEAGPAGCRHRPHVDQRA